MVLFEVVLFLSFFPFFYFFLYNSIHFQLILYNSFTFHKYGVKKASSGSKEYNKHFLINTLNISICWPLLKGLLTTIIVNFISLLYLVRGRRGVGGYLRIFDVVVCCFFFLRFALLPFGSVSFHSSGFKWPFGSLNFMFRIGRRVYTKRSVWVLVLSWIASYAIAPAAAVIVSARTREKFFKVYVLLKWIKYIFKEIKFR